MNRNIHKIFKLIRIDISFYPWLYDTEKKIPNIKKSDKVETRVRGIISGPQADKRVLFHVLFRNWKKIWGQDAVIVMQIIKMLVH